VHVLLLLLLLVKRCPVVCSTPLPVSCKRRRRLAKVQHVIM
jgi:hypothetical protein